VGVARGELTSVAATIRIPYEELLKGHLYIRRNEVRNAGIWSGARSVVETIACAISGIIWAGSSGILRSEGHGHNAVGMADSELKQRNQENSANEGYLMWRSSIGEADACRS